MIAPNNKNLSFSPTAVLACADSLQTAQICRQFRRQGWQVHLAGTGPEIRRLNRLLHPELVLVDVATAEESGWLTCAKLLMEFPTAKVVLLAGEVMPWDQTFADFVGAAAIVPRTHIALEALEDLKTDRCVAV